MKLLNANLKLKLKAKLKAATNFAREVATPGERDRHGYQYIKLYKLHFIVAANKCYTKIRELQGATRRQNRRKPDNHKIGELQEYPKEHKIGTVLSSVCTFTKAADVVKLSLLNKMPSKTSFHVEYGSETT